MLKPECERFQRHYEGDRRHSHLTECDNCRRFVDFVDDLGRIGLAAPLGDGLRARLRSVAADQEEMPPFPTVPQLPLAASLRRRLERIARRGVRASLPIWIRSPRYAVAASYLLTVLIGATLGNPAAWAGEVGQRLDRVESAWQVVRTTGHETWTGIEETTVENLTLTKDFLRASKSSLRARWLELVESLQDQETTDEADVTNGTEASI